MKRSLAAGLLVLALSACGLPAGVPPGHVPSSQPPGSLSSASQPAPEAPSSIPESGPPPLAGEEEPGEFQLDSEETRDWVEDFVVYFCLERFAAPEEISPRSIYWYAFNTMEKKTRREDYDLWKENLDGEVYPIPKAEADAFIQRHFGLTDLPYEGDSPYDEAAQAYRYYQAHGGFDFSAVILDSRLEGDLASFWTEADVWGLEKPPLALLCRFRVLRDGEGWYLRAVSMEEYEEPLGDSLDRTQTIA